MRHFNVTREDRHVKLGRIEPEEILVNVLLNTLVQLAFQHFPYYSFKFK